MANQKRTKRRNSSSQSDRETVSACIVPVGHPLRQAMDDAEKQFQSFQRDPYSYTLSPWFDLDTWSQKEGLLLLSNIEPSGADIEWGYENFAGVWIDAPQIHNAQLLDQSEFFYMVPFERRGVMPPEPEKLSPAEEEILQKRMLLSSTESTLQRTFKLWVSGLHEDDRYAPDYFVAWAVKKQVNIPWLDWAQSNGFIEEHLRPDAETATDRQERLAKLKAQLIREGRRDFNKEIARREGISVSRVKQLLKSKG